MPREFRLYHYPPPEPGLTFRVQGLTDNGKWWPVDLEHGGVECAGAACGVTLRAPDGWGECIWVRASYVREGVYDPATGAVLEQPSESAPSNWVGIQCPTERPVRPAPEADYVTGAILGAALLCVLIRRRLQKTVRF